MPDELKAWERGHRVLRAYATSNAGTTDENGSNVSRVIADLLHYCAHQNAGLAADDARHIDTDALIAKSRAIYDYEHAIGK